jgi:enoyl-CoA hydratase/carnithine racemase
MEHFRDLAHAWAAFRDDASAWVAVITGVGRDFCTGAGLKKFIPQLTGDLPNPTDGMRLTRSTLCCTAFRYTSRSLPR